MKENEACVLLMFADALVGTTSLDSCKYSTMVVWQLYTSESAKGCFCDKLLEYYYCY